LFDDLESQSFENSFKSKEKPTAPKKLKEEVKSNPETVAIQTFLNKSNEDATQRQE
jgi:hypothetical protein